MKKRMATATLAGPQRRKMTRTEFERWINLQRVSIQIEEPFEIRFQQG